MFLVCIAGYLINFSFNKMPFGNHTTENSNGREKTKVSNKRYLQIIILKVGQYNECTKLIQIDRVG